MVELDTIKKKEVGTGIYVRVNADSVLDGYPVKGQTERIRRGREWGRERLVVMVKSSSACIRMFFFSQKYVAGAVQMPASNALI